jgi:tripartite-type tricarboxylate transporter receptor subunit TctC
VPPVADTLPGFETGTWVGLFAPTAIVGRVAAATRQVLSSPETANRLAELGMQPFLAGPGPFAEYQRQEIDKWIRVVQDAGITPH